MIWTDDTKRAEGHALRPDNVDEQTVRNTLPSLKMG